MVDIYELIKKYRTKVVKIFITIIVLYFLICSLMKVIFDFSHNYDITVIQLYAIVIITCNFLSEFSPYILHNYLLYIFPFLSNYFGRGIVYILIGLLFISPSPDNEMKNAGFAILITGVICIWLNYALVKKDEVEIQNFIAIKDNFQETTSKPKREELNIFPSNDEEIIKDNSEEIIKDNSEEIINNTKREELNIFPSNKDKNNNN